MQHHNEKQVSQNIKYRTDHQEIQWCLTISHCSQRIGKEIIDKGKDQSHKYNAQIYRCYVHNALIRLHDAE